MSFKKVSVHGGHSGEFCGHATDALESVVERYIDLDFDWVCLTEHIPANSHDLIPDDEREQGWTSAKLFDRFDQYINEARRLQKEKKEQIEIFVGFETEAFSGYESLISTLINEYQPDMIVGSVHHVLDVPFDFSKDYYKRAVDKSGNIDAMYCHYYDAQLELIELFKPDVVGHFDLIRIHDPEYKKRWEVTEIRERILRNLEKIKQLGLTMDLNVRSLHKGASEPYISEPILKQAIKEGINIVPGDDSHGISTVGTYIDEGIKYLIACGGSTNWVKPGLRTT